jgi:hypothetical protein
MVSFAYGFNKIGMKGEGLSGEGGLSQHGVSGLLHSIRRRLTV